jgi:apolipoprotein N-acyltransferase
MRYFKQFISQYRPVGPPVKNFLLGLLIASTAIFFLLFYLAPVGSFYSIIFQSVVAFLFLVFIFEFNPPPPRGDKDRFALSLNAFIFFIAHYSLLLSWTFIYLPHPLPAFTYASYFFLFMSTVGFAFGCYMLKKIKLSFKTPIWEMAIYKIKYPTFPELN